MEDEYFISPSSTTTFCAVFDGHGGSKVSKFLKEKLYKRFIKDLMKGMKEKGEIVEEEMEGCEDDVQVRMIRWGGTIRSGGTNELKGLSSIDMRHVQKSQGLNKSDASKPSRTILIPPATH